MHGEHEIARAAKIAIARMREERDAELIREREQAAVAAIARNAHEQYRLGVNYGMTFFTDSFGKRIHAELVMTLGSKIAGALRRTLTPAQISMISLDWRQQWNHHGWQEAETVSVTLPLMHLSYTFMPIERERAKNFDDRAFDVIHNLSDFQERPSHS